MNLKINSISIPLQSYNNTRTEMYCTCCRILPKESSEIKLFRHIDAIRGTKRGERCTRDAAILHGINEPRSSVPEEQSTWAMKGVGMQPWNIFAAIKFRSRSNSTKLITNTTTITIATGDGKLDRIQRNTRRDYRRFLQSLFHSTAVYYLRLDLYILCNNIYIFLRVFAIFYCENRRIFSPFSILYIGGLVQNDFKRICMTPFEANCDFYHTVSNGITARFSNTVSRNMCSSFQELIVQPRTMRRAIF